MAEKPVWKNSDMEIITSKEWSEDVFVHPPILISDVPGAVKWINYTPANEFHRDAIDITSYVNEEGEVVVGLPPGIPVRAPASGYFDFAIDQRNSYINTARIFHIEESADFRPSKLICPFTMIVHLAPPEEVPDFFDYVEAGDIIGYTLSREGVAEDGRNVITTIPNHIHLEARNFDRGKKIPPFGDPSLLIEGLHDEVVERNFGEFVSTDISVNGEKMQVVIPREHLLHGEDPRLNLEVE